MDRETLRRMDPRDGSTVEALLQVVIQLAEQVDALAGQNAAPASTQPTAPAAGGTEEGS